MVQQSPRVVVAVQNRLLREMLKRVIIKSPHLEMAGEMVNGKDLIALVREEQAEWVIVSLRSDGKLPQVAEKLLNAQPSVSVLAVAPDGSHLRMGWTEPYEKAIAIAPDGKSVRLRWTEPHEDLLEDLSLDQFITVLRKGSLWGLVVQSSENQVLQ